MRVKTFILATSAVGALALSAGVANAEPNGWYGAIDAGYHTIGTIETISQGTGPQRANFDLEVQDDWAAFARLGYRFDQNWRVELEGGYRSNDIETIDNPNAGLPSGVCAVGPVASPCVGPDGEVSAASLMMNVIYDFGSEGDALRPFIGLGAGMNPGQHRDPGHPGRQRRPARHRLRCRRQLDRTGGASHRWSGLRDQRPGPPGPDLSLSDVEHGVRVLHLDGGRQPGSVPRAVTTTATP
jgi:opacity protein-like surface antigen